MLVLIWLSAASKNRLFVKILPLLLLFLNHDASNLLSQTVLFLELGHIPEMQGHFRVILPKQPR